MRPSSWASSARTQALLSARAAPLSEAGPAISDFRAKLYRRTGIAPFFHHKAKRSLPELVHAHFASGGRSALPLARALRVPLVVTLHGNDVTVRGSQPDSISVSARRPLCFFASRNSFATVRSKPVFHPRNFSSTTSGSTAVFSRLRLRVRRPGRTFRRQAGGEKRMRVSGSRNAARTASPPAMRAHSDRRWAFASIAGSTRKRTEHPLPVPR